MMLRFKLCEKTTNQNECDYWNVKENIQFADAMNVNT